MLSFHHKSQNAQFICADFRDTFKLAKPGDTIYCDPPYVALSESAYFSAYTNSQFLESDQIELATLAKISAERGIAVIISNHDTQFTRDHYHPAQIISFPVKRSISCKANQRREVQELLAIFNPN
jgi:DNA adenine methylase